MNLNFENNLLNQGFKLIGGLDEAGRGPLAGPVVAACVLVDQEFIQKNLDFFKHIKDSKKISAKKREELSKIIIESFPGVGIGFCDHKTIDRINILEATFLAMKKALGALKTKPDYILLDGNLPLPNTSYKQASIVKGDENIFAIAAASVVAKVSRDRMMLAWHEKYPQYDFATHKGYGTKKHLECLKKFGPCEIHRYSFKPVKNYSIDL